MGYSILMDENDIRPITIEPIFSKIFKTIVDHWFTFISNAFIGRVNTIITFF